MQEFPLVSLQRTRQDCDALKTCTSCAVLQAFLQCTYCIIRGDCARVQSI